MIQRMNVEMNVDSTKADSWTDRRMPKQGVRTRQNETTQKNSTSLTLVTFLVVGVMILFISIYLVALSSFDFGVHQFGDAPNLALHTQNENSKLSSQTPDGAGPGSAIRGIESSRQEGDDDETDQELEKEQENTDTNFMKREVSASSTLNPYPNNQRAQMENSMGASSSELSNEQNENFRSRDDNSRGDMSNVVSQQNSVDTDNSYGLPELAKNSVKNEKLDVPWMPFPKCSVDQYNGIMGPARMLEHKSNYANHKHEELHAAAIEMDKVRALLPPNSISAKLEEPRNSPPNSYKEKHNNFIWGPQDFQQKLKAWYRGFCENVTHVDRVNLENVQESTSKAELLQRSFQLHNVSYDDELTKPIFSEKGRVLEYPYCDLRKCPQDRFPFIYFVIPHRNRVTNLLRLISSVRNATLRCDSPPPWHDCLCMYVSDYGTRTNVPLASRLENVWRDKIRLLSRTSVTGPWIKARVSTLLDLVLLISYVYRVFSQTYNSALRYIPTPSKRSLVFHVDADLVATDTSCINKGLQNAILGKLYNSVDMVIMQLSLHEHAFIGMGQANEWHFQ